MYTLPCVLVYSGLFLCLLTTAEMVLLQVWVYAAAQNFNSIGIGFGAMITFSSYNKFTNNVLTDAWVISLVNAGTSLMAGIIVFSTMGNIASEQGRNITDVVAEGMHVGVHNVCLILACRCVLDT